MVHTARIVRKLGPRTFLVEDAQIERRSLRLGAESEGIGNPERID
jgi:hypothetical protein